MGYLSKLSGDGACCDPRQSGSQHLQPRAGSGAWPPPVGKPGLLKYRRQAGGMAHQAEALWRTHRLVNEMALANREAIPGVDLDAQQLDQGLDQRPLEIEAQGRPLLPLILFLCVPVGSY